MNTPAYTARRPGQALPAPVSPEAYVGLACDPAACVVVRACAGAGKTWLLVARMARCLLAGYAPQDMLAITFTRKAAAEMQQRLLELLQDWSRLDDAALRDEIARRGLPHAGADVLRRARNLYADVLAASAQPTVSTFHGWFSQLLRAAPLRFGLPQNFELLENEQPLLQQAWRQLYARLQDDQALRADYRALVARMGRATAAQLIELVVQRRGEFVLAAQAGTLAQGLHAAEPEAWLHWRDRMAPELRLWAQAWASCGGSYGRAALGPLQAALDSDDAHGVAAALRAVLLTAQGAPRSARSMATRDVKIEIARLGLDGDPALRWDRLAAEFLALHDAHDAHDIERIHAWALRLGAELLAGYERLKAEQGLLDFSDLELHARRLLADADVSAWVQMRLDRRYAQVLIDEFQDTNPVQWQALQAWLSAYAGDAQRPSVFIVGDDKQSIYRFRRADPQVFEAATNFLHEGFGAVLLSAQHTRRLSLAVRDWVNAVFAAAPAMDFVAHTTASREQGRVALLPALDAEDASAQAPDGEAAVPAASQNPGMRVRDTLREADVDAEIGKVERDAMRVAGLVRDLLACPSLEDGAGGLRPARPGDVLLLLRKRKDRMDLYLRALLAAGIPAAAGDSEASLLDTLEAQDLLALLNALVSPGSDLDFAQVLKSPIAGLGDADLLAIARLARETGQGWWHAAHHMAARGDATPALRRFLALAARWSDLLGSLPPHDLIDRILAEGELKSRYARAVPRAMAAQSLAHLDAFLHLALDLDGGRFLTPYAFVRRLKRGLARAALPELHAGEVVRLSTIHGAKGLEAPIVILADADSRPLANGPSVLLHWPAEAPHPLHFSLQLSSRRVHPAQRALVRVEQLAAEREDWNLLYVAMTRARQQLWITRVPVRGEAQWSRRLAVHAEALDVVMPVDAGQRRPGLAAPSAGDEGEPDGPERIGVPWLARPEPAQGQAIDLDEAQARAARIGSAMHSLLEAAAAAPHAESVLAACDAGSLALQLDLDPGEALAAIQAALRIVRSPQARVYFDAAQVRWARNEVDVAWPAADGGEPGWARIDRLVELDEAVWVLDYKLAARNLDPARYAPILQRYAQAAAALRPGKPVRVALIGGDGSVGEWRAADPAKAVSA